MKFQNPSLNSVLTGRTDERTSRNQYAPHFFKVGGIINVNLLGRTHNWIFPILFILVGNDNSLRRQSKATKYYIQFLY